MKNLFTVKDWVCLVDQATLLAKQDAIRKTALQHGNWEGVVHEKLWRQITVTATAEGIHLNLMNVNQEAANGGYWSGGEACLDHRFTWDDLHDVEFVEKMLAREQVAVYLHVTAMLMTLRARMAPLREALAAF